MALLTNLNTRSRLLAAVLLSVSILVAVGYAYAEIVEPEDEVAPRATLTAAVPETRPPVEKTTPACLPMTDVFGASVRGRPLVVDSFGFGERRVLVVGGVHGDEFGGLVASALVRWLAANPAAVPPGATVDVVPYLNPDGRILGRRANARGVDLNRNFPARNWRRTGGQAGATAGIKPGSEPETTSLVALMTKRRYSCVISLHSHGGLIDYDGPGGLGLARRMSLASSAPVVRLPLYPGSMSSYVPERYRMPIITWELSGSSLSSGVLAGLLSALR